MNIRQLKNLAISFCLVAIIAPLSAMATPPAGLLGGDDRIFARLDGARYEDLDIASNGDIYVVYQYEHATDGLAVRVARSTTGGTSFSTWGEFRYPGTTETASRPSIVIAEGVEDRCYVAFVHGRPAATSEIIVAWENLSSSSANFTNQVAALSHAALDHHAPDLATDDVNFSDYYVYLVAEGHEANGDDIWFTRTVDYGASWETSYRIGTISDSSGDFKAPAVSFGFGSFVHAVWEVKSITHIFDAAIWYRRAEGAALGGISAWDPVDVVTTFTDGVADRDPQIAASHDSGNVVLVYRRDIFVGPIPEPQPPMSRTATDQGAAGFATSAAVPVVPTATRITDLLYVPSSGNFFAAMGIASNQIMMASAAAPATWTEFGTFELSTSGPTTYYVGSGLLAYDPTHGDRLAVTNARSNDDLGDHILLDAEWFSDPGAPIMRSGFPLPLAAAPVAEPVVVDLDGDGNLEIIYGDINGDVWAVTASGDIMAGWPVNIGALTATPIAAGKLALQDEVSIVLGTADGQVFALAGDGSVQTGWPVTIVSDEPAYVSIGALGGPFPQTVIVACGNRIAFLDYAGRAPSASVDRTFLGNSTNLPCASGDIDGDGVAEIVFQMDNVVLAAKRDVTGSIFSRAMPANISGAITLGDIDLDGDLEIAVPLANGEMYLLDHTGVDVPGWPYSVGATTALRSAAWADVQGSAAPELSFATSNARVHLVTAGGVSLPDYPVIPSLFYSLDASPAIAEIDGGDPDVILGTTGFWGFAWDVNGTALTGWPRALNAACSFSPAVTDLDQDGFREVVLMTEDDLQVFELRTSAGAAAAEWTMTGHDVRRTGCSDCPTDLVTAVGDESAATPTRVSFAAPHPNPTSDNAVFRFAIPTHAVVSLDVIDVRGRRVRTVTRSEMSAGHYVLGWDGRDKAGHPVGNGVYYARLKVSGPGVAEAITRKVVVVR